MCEKNSGPVAMDNKIRANGMPHNKLSSAPFRLAACTHVGEISKENKATLAF
ncbi:hypothetical protein ACNR0F_03505 [Kingella kingae]|uniref:hypothetical protein n=1 Tax=Kingella kingae TaxID=504 RepID=UPI003AB78327